MNRARLFGLALSVLIPFGEVAAQPPGPIYCRQPSFRIPFDIESADQPRLREVQLYVSEDRGMSWKRSGTAGPMDRHFPFKAERDGGYWFAVRTVDQDGKVHPPALNAVIPSLQVVVDTQLPVVSLRTLPARQEQVGVEWDARDENLGLQPASLEYRALGGGDWQTVAGDLPASGQRYWVPMIRGPVEARLRVRDRADNQAAAVIPLGGGGVSSIDPRPTRNPLPAGPNVKVINSNRISLNYELTDVGPSGVSLVELWYTSDGRAWQRYGDDPDHASPFLMEVNGEGTYGLCLVVKSGVGIGDKAPAAGDPPQLWVEVDLTRPVVQLFGAEAGRGSEAGTVTISWSAADKNLASQPITLSYAEQADGEWKPIAAGLDNSGRYVWRVPPGAPYRFFVRVEAADRGGNIGKAESGKPVIVDLAQPKGRLLGVDGAAKPL